LGDDPNFATTVTNLLIAPEGIEMNVLAAARGSILVLLIAPEGIEIQQINDLSEALNFS